MKINSFFLALVAIALLTLAAIEGWRTLSPHMQILEPAAISDNTLSGSRQWSVLNDPSAPLTLMDAVVNIAGQSWFVGFSVKARESIAAYQLRLLMLDTFGRPLDSRDYVHTTSIQQNEHLSTDDLLPIPQDLLQEFDARFYSSVAFMIAARTEDGKLWRCNATALMRKLQDMHLHLPASTEGCIE